MPSLLVSIPRIIIENIKDPTVAGICAEDKSGKSEESVNVKYAYIIEYIITNKEQKLLHFFFKKSAVFI